MRRLRMEIKVAQLREAKTTIRFSAKLLPHKANGSAESLILALPKNASAKLPSRGTVMIEGAINAFPFRATLESDGKGSHRLRVNKTMSDGAGAEAGEIVTVEIARAGDEPECRVPADLRKALAAAPRAQEGWKDITPLARRDWVFSISTAKQAETRKRRIEKACDMLASGKRRLCCFPGIEWIMRDDQESCGMWLPLPSSERRVAPGPARRKTA